MLKELRLQLGLRHAELTTVMVVRSPRCGVHREHRDRSPHSAQEKSRCKDRKVREHLGHAGELPFIRCVCGLGPMRRVSGDEELSRKSLNAVQWMRNL